MFHTEQINTGGNRFLAAGIVFALILLGVAAIYAVRVFEKKIEEKITEKHKNPLFTTVEEQIDDGKPEIPGVVVYDAEDDVEQIELDTKKREAQFRENIEKKRYSLDTEKELHLLQKKDEFAAKRLAFLKKIEASETKAERLKLIKEFRKLCEENGSDAK